METASTSIVLNAATPDTNRPPIRSRLTCVAINPIITAASELIEQLAEIRHLPPRLPLGDYQQLLITKIKALETQLRAETYHQEMILLTRFTLCVALDEAIMCSHWLKENEWDNYQLTDLFSHDSLGSEQFFPILGRLCEDPAHYTDILELMYICLSLGYEGEYQYTQHGRERLEQILDGIYHCIRSQRGEYELALSPHAASHYHSRPLQASRKVRWWQTIAISLFILATVYTGITFIFNAASGALYASLAEVAQTPTSTNP